MTDRERVQLALSHREPDCVPLQDVPWPSTRERWEREGLPPDADLTDYFGFAMLGARPDLSFGFPAEAVEETEEYTLTRDDYGALTRRWKRATTTPECLDFTINSPAAWAEHKSRLAWSPDRVDWAHFRSLQERCRAQGKWFYFDAGLGYDMVQCFVGSERLLMAMALEPDWVGDMFATIYEEAGNALEEMVAAGLDFDGCHVCDDMGYRNGPLFSPAMFERFELPHHRRFYARAHALGLPVILHSCGQIGPFLPGLVEAGLDCLNPLEVKAGMDLIALKRQYGEKLAFMGGIDVRKMAHPDPAVIEEEIATKVGFARQGGGYIYHSDHSVPDNVSFAQYCRVIELVRHWGRSTGG